ncbi:MAG: hypothetical protein E6Q97_06590 [Desulfurellales bacterium]|nr:MAG: hypothetical protein E6Q97_06590 [Desulfurellales bacterium]
MAIADAQATIAALQARVQELEARQHFGACAKCLTNAWRICKEGTPDAVEMKCSNGSTWWLCDYCSMKIRLAETYRIAQDSENERIELKAQLTQRTAELEALKIHCAIVEEHKVIAYKDAANLQAELERVSLLSSHNERRFEEVDKKYKELRTLILALPKVEGEIVAQAGYVKDRKKVYACFGSDADMTAYAAIVQHRQGMEAKHEE